MSRMTLYVQFNDYFEVFKLFSVFFAVYLCFSVFFSLSGIRYPVSGTGYRISGFYRIIDTGYR